MRTQFPPRRGAPAVLALAWLAALAAPAAAQTPNYDLPPAEIERKLKDEPFQIVGMADNRWEGDRTQRTAIRFRDGTELKVKWARSAEGGFALNNQPRYELAAYEIQKLFLEPADWVVPPTSMRELPLRVYRQLDPELPPTFEGTESVLVAIQYWLNEVEPHVQPDTARYGDDAYARRLGYLNLLTYLIRHADANPGNVLISKVGAPRLFAVDNGVAFRSPDSPRGTWWQELHVDRLPGDAIERLRAVSEQDLTRALAVVAELRTRADGRLETAAASAKRSPNRGVEFADGLVQFGLTDVEIADIWERLQALLEKVDAGKITTF